MSLKMVVIKGCIAVIYLFLVIKTLGKKQISELNIFDYIIGLSLGNIAAEMTVNDEITIMEGLASMTIYALFSLFVLSSIEPATGKYCPTIVGGVQFRFTIKSK